MNARILTLLPCIALFALEAAYGQSNDLATERSRIANQRIQAEAEQRAREEQERLRQPEEQARLQAEFATAQPASALAPTAQPAARPAPVREARPATSGPSGADVSRALEQLRTLGELRDAGYVTEQEFDRIKRRILESQF